MRRKKKVEQPMGLEVMCVCVEGMLSHVGLSVLDLIIPDEVAVVVDIAVIVLVDGEI